MTRSTVAHRFAHFVLAWHRREQPGPRWDSVLNRLQNGCAALIKFLVEGGFDSHAPPPSIPNSRWGQAFYRNPPDLGRSEGVKEEPFPLFDAKRSGL